MVVPRKSALLMLRSTISTVSAPATCLFRGSITNPAQLLCTLRGRVNVGSRNTCYRAARYGLTRTGLAPVGLHQLLLAPSEIQASRGRGGRAFAFCAGQRFCYRPE